MKEQNRIRYQGRAWTYGDDINTDLIIPARYLYTSDPEELALHAMEDLNGRFAGEVASGDVITAGDNFGCGSSREHAPVALRAAGVSCVIARSFARIFYRNAINVALPILECPEAVDGIATGDTVEIDAERGLISNISSGDVYEATPFPGFLQGILSAGGLIPYARMRHVAGQGET